MNNEASLLTGSTYRLLETFKKHNIACQVVSGELNLITYQTKDGQWRLMKGLLSEKLPLFAQQMCDNKLWSDFFFAQHGLPTPETMLVESEDGLEAFLAKHGAVVIKPHNGAHGHGVSMNITSSADVPAAIKLAQSFSRKVIAQQQVIGKDIRILVINGKIISALERRPAHVEGDGIRTIYELIMEENRRPERGKVGVDPLVKIPFEAVKRYLSNERLASTPDKDEIVRVVGPSNHSMGGSIYDVTDSLPQEVKNNAEHICKMVTLPIAGVDVILTNDKYYFLEINASPGIGIHDYPALGTKSDCFAEYVRLLYEDNWWRTEVK